MTLKDQFKYLVGGYYGIEELDEYNLKEYLLKDIENYIKEFIKQNPIEDYDYKEEANIIRETMPLKTRLQDSLIVLNKIDAPIEVIIMVKQRLKEI